MAAGGDLRLLPLIGGIFLGLTIVGAYFARILEVVVQPFG